MLKTTSIVLSLYSTAVPGTEQTAAAYSTISTFQTAQWNKDTEVQETW